MEPQTQTPIIIIGLRNGLGKLLVYPGDGTQPIRFGLADFRFDAIPYGLSWLNRFGGQAGLYSVAQHSVLLSRIVGPNPLHQLAALIHDTGEPMGAGDSNTFLKRALGCTRMSEYEDALCEAIWGFTGLPETFAKYHRAVHPIDKALGTEEARQLGFTVPDGAPELSKEAKAKIDIQAAHDRWEPSLAATVWTLAWDSAFNEAMEGQKWLS